jgi:uncharacterized protein (DUF433 family)
VAGIDFIRSVRCVPDTRPFFQEGTDLFRVNITLEHPGGSSAVQLGCAGQRGLTRHSKGIISSVTPPSCANKPMPPMDERNLIIRDPDILGGIPVFAGTRVPIRTLMDYLEDGHSLDVFLDDFPTVTRPQAQQLIALLGRQLVEQTSG